MSNSMGTGEQGAPHRRPRVREVSSRFMSPSPAPAGCDQSPKHPAGQLRRRQELEPFSCSAHENIPKTCRSLDTPFQHRSNPKVVAFSTQQQQQRKQRAVKLFKENGYGEQQQPRTGKCSRLDTPTDRIVPSKFRRPTNSSVATDAAKLLQSTGLSFSSVPPLEPSSSVESSVEGNSCPNSPISRNWPEAEGDNKISSNKLLDETSSKFSTPSLCSRSMNLQHYFKSKPSATTTSLALPPQPTRRKPLTSQEQVHSLRLLHNHHLLWRYANAKAQVSMHAQTMEIQNQFLSLGADISHLRDAVKRKHIELALLQKTEALSAVVEGHMPYLDEWSALEEEYTDSLSGSTNALTNSLLRLPVSANVQVNVKEAAEALDSAIKTMEMIVVHVQSFMPKAEEMDTLMSELATVIDGERALLQECGNLLAKTHTSQVEDCSLRAHLMQLCL